MRRASSRRTTREHQKRGERARKMLGFAVGSEQSTSFEKTSCLHGKEKGADEGP